MSENCITEEDIQYICESTTRKKIMRHLYGPMQDYVTIFDLAKSIGEQIGNVNFHCDRLHERGLLDIRKVSHKLIKMTRKGSLIWQEVERRNLDY